jgi:extracellular factor (EF) 3-hydroxypalmitic acid methyl ester biosynthesis protein
MPNLELETHAEQKVSLVFCSNSQGMELRGSLLRLTRYLAVFEAYNPAAVLRLSEVLGDFKIIVNDRTIYSGRAVLSGLINAGTVMVCEVKLDEAGFCIASFSPTNGEPYLRAGFSEFLQQWQTVYRVLPEFKVVVADMQTFLMDLRLWLDQVELEIRSAPAGDRTEMEAEAARGLSDSFVPAFDAMHERLESISESIETELRPVHQNFSKRQLHPLMMCSPFAYRTYYKPLGYAGDYEMVDMIMRDPCEGSSLFAKAVNLWFLSQWPARAHRNRIHYLRECLRQESLKGARRGQPIRVLNLGCGPAREVQEFLAEDPLSDHAQFTLLDFNEETIQHARGTLEELKKRFGRRTVLQLQRKSVHQVLKEGARTVSAPHAAYDFIYCAGLFDYLPDRTCKQLMNIFYDWLAPGGLVAATNVDNCRPFRHMLEFVLDWHLIYRDTRKSSALLPDAAGPDLGRIQRDLTGVNVIIEARKAENG